MPSPVAADRATDPGWRSSRRLTSSPGQVGLVEGHQHRHLVGPDLPQDGLAPPSIWASGSARRGVDHVDQEVGLGHLLQRRPERLHQLRRQLAHEPDGVGEQHPLAAGEVEAAGGGVDGGEQAVLHQHAGVGEPVEQGRLAGVGVADDGHRLQPGAVAGLALGAPVLGEHLEVGLELADPPQQAPAVDLELGLAAAEPGADAARLLAEALALPPQPGQPVAEHGQLHLRLSLLAVGVLAEDVEDDGGAVDGRAARGSSPGCGSGPASAPRRTRRCRRRTRRTAPAAPRPCPCPRRWPGRARRGAGGRARPRRRRRCRPGPTARRATPRPRRGWSGGTATPTRTMRSRRPRSMSDISAPATEADPATRPGR